MPTSLETTVVFNGYARTSSTSINSIPKLEVEIFIGNKFSQVVFPAVEFQGNDNRTIVGPSLPSSNNMKNTGFTHQLAKVEFQGIRNKPDSTVLFVDDIEILIPDSQDYVIVKEVVQANLPFWS